MYTVLTIYESCRDINLHNVLFIPNELRKSHNILTLQQYVPVHVSVGDILFRLYVAVGS